MYIACIITGVSDINFQCISMGSGLVDACQEYYTLHCNESVLCNLRNSSAYARQRTTHTCTSIMSLVDIQLKFNYIN